MQQNHIHPWICRRCDGIIIVGPKKDLMNASHDPSAFDVIVSFALFISFVTFAFCMATLRSHVDEDKLRSEKSISKVFAGGIPPERVLTDVGLRRAKVGKIAIGVFVVCVAYLVIRKNIM